MGLHASGELIDFRPLWIVRKSGWEGGWTFGVVRSKFRVRLDHGISSQPLYELKWINVRPSHHTSRDELTYVLWTIVQWYSLSFMYILVGRGLYDTFHSKILSHTHHSTFVFRTHHSKLVSHTLCSNLVCNTMHSIFVFNTHHSKLVFHTLYSNLVSIWLSSNLVLDRVGRTVNNIIVQIQAIWERLEIN